jgi:two-component system chemotaxis response regulator CheY
MAKRVLSVGQCGADHWGLSRALRQAFGAEVVAAAGADEALDRLRDEAFDLVLVNRVFDADGASGVELIRRITGGAGLSPPPVMLVSNYDDAQREAVAAGAAPGFGKAGLGRPPMLERVGAVLRD